MGDCTATKEPTAIVLPQQKTWKWETKTTSADGVALQLYYAEDPTRRGKLWVPDQNYQAGWTAMKAPLLLAVLLVLFKAIQDKGKPLMPHKIWGLAIKIINKAADRALATTNWALILTWCILAAQQDTNGNSLLGLSVDAVTEGDDDYFAKWIDQRLDATFGPRPTTGPLGPAGRGGMGQVNDPTQVSAIMANEVGKGVALGLWAIGHLQRDPTQVGGGYETKTKGYTKDDIMVIMRFAGVYDGKNLPDIWDIFNATKGKNIDAYYHHIFAPMKQYAYDWCIQIDLSSISSRKLSRPSLSCD